jgi:hypothetical protein
MTAAMYDLARTVQLGKRPGLRLGLAWHTASGRPISSRPSRLTHRGVSCWRQPDRRARERSADRQTENLEERT